MRDLSLAQWITSARDGKIEIISEPVVKATATVRLPLAMNKEANA